tara:strand:- start:129 stop:1259 length:1131 start_codon:yes stop_codon:yes gene_type:complete
MPASKLFSKLLSLILFFGLVHSSQSLLWAQLPPEVVNYQGNRDKALAALKKDFLGNDSKRNLSSAITKHRLHLRNVLYSLKKSKTPSASLTMGIQYMENERVIWEELSRGFSKLAQASDDIGKYIERVQSEIETLKATEKRNAGRIEKFDSFFEEVEAFRVFFRGIPGPTRNMLVTTTVAKTATIAGLTPVEVGELVRLFDQMDRDLSRISISETARYFRTNVAAMTNLFQYDLLAQDAEMKELTDKFEDAHDQIASVGKQAIAFKLVNISQVPNQDRNLYATFERSLDDWVRDQMEDGLDVWSDWVDKVEDYKDKTRNNFENIKKAFLPGFSNAKKVMLELKTLFSGDVKLALEETKEVKKLLEERQDEIEDEDN